MIIIVIIKTIKTLKAVSFIIIFNVLAINKWVLASWAEFIDVHLFVRIYLVARTVIVKDFKLSE